MRALCVSVCVRARARRCVRPTSVPDPDDARARYPTSRLRAWTHSRGRFLPGRRTTLESAIVAVLQQSGDAVTAHQCRQDQTRCRVQPEVCKNMNIRKLIYRLA